jgi:hypothetical protein
MSKRVKIGLVVAFAVVVAYILLSPMQLGKVSCEVCMEFKGQKACRTAKGPSADEATVTARDNSCARIAFGREDSILCGNTPPASVRCTEDARRVFRFSFLPRSSSIPARSSRGISSDITWWGPWRGRSSLLRRASPSASSFRKLLRTPTSRD